jgi:hypothetical protein
MFFFCCDGRNKNFVANEILTGSEGTVLKLSPFRRIRPSLFSENSLDGSVT